MRRLTTDPARDYRPSGPPTAGRSPLPALAEGFPARSTSFRPSGGATAAEQPARVRGMLSWSPDGRWLAAAPRPRRRASAPSPRHPPRRRGGRRGPLDHHAERADLPHGRRLLTGRTLPGLCGLPTHSCHLEVIGLGDDYVPKGTARRLTRKVFWAGGLAWTRDGKSVVYADRRPAPLARRGSPETGPPERIEVAGQGAGAPAIARPGTALRSCGSWPTRTSGGSRRGARPRPWPLYGRRLRAAASRRTGLIAWESGRAGRGKRSGWPTRTVPTRSNSPGARAWQGSPRWSPDGGQNRLRLPGRGRLLAHLDHRRRRRISTPTDAGPRRREHAKLVAGWPLHLFHLQSRRRSGYLARAREGRTEERVTHNGGYHAYESADGKTLFFTEDSTNRRSLPCPPRRCRAKGHRLRRGLHRRSGGRLPSGLRGGPALTTSLPAGSGDRPGPAPRDPGEGRRLPTVSPDGKTILYTKTISGGGSDLVMIENFR